MSDQKKKVPDALLEQRPGVAMDENAVHPEVAAPTYKRVPTGYTKGLHDRIIELIRKHRSPEIAAASCGITKQRLQYWIQEGRAGNTHLAAFADDMECALAEAEGDLIDRWLDPEDKDAAKHAADFAKATRPGRYSRELAARLREEQESFLIRLENALEPAVFEKVLTAIAGMGATENRGLLTTSTENDGGEREE